MQRLSASSRVFTRLFSPKNVQLNGNKGYAGFPGSDIVSHRETAIFNKGTMNDLPVPQGSWQEYHQKKNSTFNMLLGLSTVFFVVTFYACQKGGVFFLNAGPDYKSIPVDARSKSDTDDFGDD